MSCIFVSSNAGVLQDIANTPIYIKLSFELEEKYDKKMANCIMRTARSNRFADNISIEMITKNLLDEYQNDVVVYFTKCAVELKAKSMFHTMRTFFK